MLLNINPDSQVSVYMQIEYLIRGAIASGALLPDKALPSIREASERLSVNANTISKSYRGLELRGLVYSKRGSGIFVAEGADELCREECEKRFRSRLEEFLRESQRAGIPTEKIEEMIEISLGRDSTLLDKSEPQPIPTPMEGARSMNTSMRKVNRRDGKSAKYVNEFLDAFLGE